jgi:hypothetical protein
MLFPQTLDFFGMVGKKIDSFCAREQVAHVLGLSRRSLCCSHVCVYMDR